MGPRDWPESKGADRYRRAIYTFRFRSVPYPMLETFDAPNGDSTCVRRARSNTPLQALTTLNEPMYLEMARALAMKTLMEGGASEDAAHHLCLPAMRVAQTYAEGSGGIARLAGQGDAALCGRQAKSVGCRGGRSCASADTAARRDLQCEAAAWTIVSRVMLNLDETITKE